MHITDHFCCNKRNRLKSLDEYYFIKGACSEPGTAALTKILLEEREKEAFRSQTRKIMTFLCLIVLIEAGALFNILRTTKHDIMQRSGPGYQGKSSFKSDDTTIKSNSFLSSARIKLVLFTTNKFHTSLADDTTSNFSIQGPSFKPKPRFHLLWGIYKHHAIPPHIQAQVLSQAAWRAEEDHCTYMLVHFN